MDQSQLPQPTPPPPIISPIPHAPVKLLPRLLPILGLTIVVVLLGSVGFFVFSRSQPKPTPNPIPSILPSPTPPDLTNYLVVLKENPTNSTQTDIYLSHPKTSVETFFTTVTDVYTQHYHNSEYHLGEVYVIRRTGGNQGYTTNPNWTDELWRYNPQKQGQKLFSARGLDFRVTDNNTYIAINTNDNLYLLNHNGTTLKTFGANEVTIPDESQPAFDIINFSSDTVWLDNTFGPVLLGLVSVNLQSFTVTKYDITSLSIGSEYAFNPTQTQLAYSNYPPLFDIESSQTYQQSHTKVNLVVYNPITQTQLPVASSIAKPFKPTWLDAHALEYDDPTASGRLTQILP